MKPIVTIGICVRNCEDTIEETIESIARQDFPHKYIEAIFVDDGSEDRTLTLIADSVSRLNMRVMVFHNEWSGLGPARNTVVDGANGEYIIWVDGDIVLSKDFVTKQVEFMEHHPRVGITGGKYAMVLEGNLVSILENAEYLVDSLKYVGETTTKLPGTGASIYRVVAIRQIGGFDNNIKGAEEDTDAAYRIAKAGWVLYRGPAMFYGKCKETWKAIWNQYLWYGYGAHYILHKHDGIFSLPKMTPFAGLIVGFLYSLTAYRLIGQSAVFFMPLHFFFKKVAWCIGFIKAHFKGYGHMR